MKMEKKYVLFNLTSIIFILLMLYLSYLKYPIKYTFYDNQISHLGSPTENPKGKLIFDIGMFLFGIFTIPIIYRLYKIYSHYMFITSKIFSLFGIMCISGLCLLPFYSVDNWDIHWIIAEMIFIGFIGMVTCLCIIWVVKLRKQLNNVINTIFVALYISLYIIFILLLINMNTLWEWIYFISMLIYILIISIVHFFSF